MSSTNSSNGDEDGFSERVEEDADEAGERFHDDHDGPLPEFRRDQNQDQESISPTVSPKILGDARGNRRVANKVAALTTGSVAAAAAAAATKTTAGNKRGRTRSSKEEPPHPTRNERAAGKIAAAVGNIVATSVPPSPADEKDRRILLRIPEAFGNGAFAETGGSDIVASRTQARRQREEEETKEETKEEITAPIRRVTESRQVRPGVEYVGPTQAVRTRIPTRPAASRPSRSSTSNILIAVPVDEDEGNDVIDDPEFRESRPRPVQAEIYTGGGDKRKEKEEREARQRRSKVYGVVITVVVVAVILTILWGSGNGPRRNEANDPRGSATAPTTMPSLSPTATQTPTEIPSPKPTTMEMPSRVPAIFVVANQSQLEEAVDEYLDAIGGYGVTDLPPIGTWDVSAVTSFWHLFSSHRNGNASNFSDDGIRFWDVQNVTDFAFMFAGASKFDADLSSWDTSRVTSMNYMFSYAASFRGNGTGLWKVSRVASMSNMFQCATEYDADLSSWDTSRATKMMYMFEDATSFRGTGTGLWDVSRVTSMSRMFRNATSFQGKGLADWDVSKVTSMRGMFDGASNFSSNLCSWGGRISSSTDVGEMFRGTSCPNTTDPGLGTPFCYDCV